ncbi:glyoxalase [Cognatishimia sp. F0-27]|uniref:glyoxalase n=1 Tax=Cognatishimia sp. F0-27 TaxID=2816855 RepID=UPI001D0BF6F1|nr:glyoxalase [Cognatishimia sp. F0-27]MCC1491961.1 glyoxalase [Cognatishimia sp. F0-27]
MGLNILVRDVKAQAARLAALFDMEAFRVSSDFAILRYGAAVFQLHADHTYHNNPYLALLPETPPRGAGIELRLYETDPDTAAGRADAHDMLVLQPPTDKPHGLRECTLICPDGYAWVPSRPL